jgi:hypothetical protein
MSSGTAVRPELVARLGELARELESSPEELTAAAAEYQRRLTELRASIDEGDASGELLDGDAVFDRLEAELQARIAASGR